MIANTYQPCAYLLEGVEASTLLEDGIAFQHYLALGRNRLTAATEVSNVHAWINRSLALRLRPVLLLSSYDSPLAREYRTYCSQFDSGSIQWLVWPPEPEEMTQIVRDPDPEIVAALSSVRTTERVGTSDSAPTQRRAVWHQPLLKRLTRWLEDFGDLLPDGVAPDDSSIAAISSSLDNLQSGSPRVTHERQLDKGLAASNGQNSEPLKLPVGSWTIERQEIPDDPDHQFLIFRCQNEVIDDFAGRRVQVELGEHIFELGLVDERGRAEVLIPRGLDFKVFIDIRIIEGE